MNRRPPSNAADRSPSPEGSLSFAVAGGGIGGGSWSLQPPPVREPGVLVGSSSSADLLAPGRQRDASEEADQRAREQAPKDELEHLLLASADRARGARRVDHLDRPAAVVAHRCLVERRRCLRQLIRRGALSRAEHGEIGILIVGCARVLLEVLADLFARVRDGLRGHLDLRSVVGQRGLVVLRGEPAAVVLKLLDQRAQSALRHRRRGTGVADLENLGPGGERHDLSRRQRLLERVHRAASQGAQRAATTGAGGQILAEQRVVGDRLRERLRRQQLDEDALLRGRGRGAEDGTVIADRRLGGGAVSTHSRAVDM